jgi:hypothetical protein
MYVMYEAAASCTDISRAPVTNWEGLQDTVRREIRDVSHLLRYGVTIRCYVKVLCYKCGRALKEIDFSSMFCQVRAVRKLYYRLVTNGRPNSGAQRKMTLICLAGYVWFICKFFWRGEADKRVCPCYQGQSCTPE